MEEILDICMPVYKSIDVRTFVSFFTLAMPNCSRRLYVEHGTTGDIAKSRNELVKRIVDADEPAEFSLWIDSDVSFESDSLKKLIAAMRPDVGVVTGLTRGRTQPHDIVCFHLGDDFNYRSAFSHIKGKTIAREPIEVDACGADFMLVRNDVFRVHSATFDRRSGWTEDLSFCQCVRSAGYKILAHGDVRIGHQTEITLVI